MEQHQERGKYALFIISPLDPVVVSTNYYVRPTSCPSLRAQRHYTKIHIRTHMDPPPDPVVDLLSVLRTSYEVLRITARGLLLVTAAACWRNKELHEPVHMLMEDVS